MSWYSRLGLVPLMVLCASASAQRIQLGESDESKARLDAQVLASNAEISPVEIHLAVPAIDVDKQTDGFDKLNIEGLVPTTAPGNPELLTTGALIAVPAGFEARLTVVSELDKDVQDVQVRPAQRQFRCETGANADGFAFNSNLYQSDAVFPASAVELQEVGYLQGLRLMRVALNPVRMTASSKQLHVTTDLVVQVSFVRVARSAQVVLPPAFYQLAKDVAANGTGLGRTVVAGTQETLLVIVADKFKDTIQPLIDWKRSKGLNVDVATASQAGRSKEAIRQYIQTYYNSHSQKPTYLLLVGNKDTLPTYMESTMSGSAASDLKYSLIAGNDNVPDLFYGRLVADNETDVTTQMNRWIQYEKSPTAGNWWSDGTTIASGEGSGPSDKEYAEQIQAALKAGTYQNVDGFYQGEGTATAANISGALNEGRSWLTYIGHGSGTSWGSTNDTFNNATVSKLHNAGHLPIIIDVACQNASWVKLSKCFGKAWMTSTANGEAIGASGYYGGSVNVSWHEPATMSVGIAKYHFEKHIASLGGTVLAGQLYLVEKMGNGDNTLDNLKWYNLLGDPSMVVRTVAP